MFLRYWIPNDIQINLSSPNFVWGSSISAPPSKILWPPAPQIREEHPASHPGWWVIVGGSTIQLIGELAQSRLGISNWLGS